MNKKDEKILLRATAIGVLCIFFGAFTQPISETLSLIIVITGVFLTFIGITSLLIAFLLDTLKKGGNNLVEIGSGVTKNIKKSAYSLKPLLKTQKKDMEDFVRLLEVNTDEELAEHLIFAALARVENPSLSEEFLNHLPVIAVDEVHKVKAQLQMINLQFKSDLKYAPLTAGNVIWIMTLRSVESFEHLLLAKRMWKELRRGRDYVGDKLLEMNIPTSEETLIKAKFIPKL